MVERMLPHHLNGQSTGIKAPPDVDVRRREVRKPTQYIVARRIACDTRDRRAQLQADSAVLPHSPDSGEEFHHNPRSILGRATVRSRCCQNCVKPPSTASSMPVM